MSKCRSCGVDWSEHVGIVLTCETVQSQAEEIAKLKTEIERLHKIELDRWTGWAKELRMILCKTCGNKRCPAAGDERYKCTGSNEPGQVAELIVSVTLNEDKASEWVSVRDQLPPTDRQVWFCCEIEGDFTEVDLGQFIGLWTESKNAVAMETDGDDWSPCSHWMELPKPPVKTS